MVGAIRGIFVFDHRRVYLASGHLKADEIHLNQRRKRIPDQELSGLIDRALSYILKGSRVIVRSKISISSLHMR